MEDIIRRWLGGDERYMWLFLAIVVVLCFAVFVFGLRAEDYKLIRGCRSIGVLRAFILSCWYASAFHFGIVGDRLAIKKSLKPRKTGRLIVPEGVEVLVDHAFDSCGFTSVRLPKTLRSIGSYAFKCCPIKEINIPDGTEQVDKYAFSGCDMLEKVDMPFVRNISGRTFYCCNRLGTIIVAGHRFELSGGGNELDRFWWYSVATELAREGSAAAMEHLTGNIRMIVAEGMTALVEGALSLPDDLPAETIESAIDTAVKNKCREIYVMLVQYKRDRTGFGEEDIPGRFEL